MTEFRSASANKVDELLVIGPVFTINCVINFMSYELKVSGVGNKEFLRMIGLKSSPKHDMVEHSKTNGEKHKKM